MVGRAYPRCRAFSLVELTVVLVLIGVLAALAAPRFANASSHRRAESAADRIIADFRYAQERARATSADYTIRFETGHSYVLFSDDKNHSRSTDLSEEPYGVSYTYKLMDSDTSITFNGFGVPSTGGLITVTRGRHTVTLVVNELTGEVGRP